MKSLTVVAFALAATFGIWPEKSSAPILNLVSKTSRLVDDYLNFKMNENKEEENKNAN